jgi:hypothetical protein
MWGGTADGAQAGGLIPRDLQIYAPCVARPSVAPPNARS